MFNFGYKSEAISHAVAGCAITGYAKAGKDYVTNWPAYTACSDIRPVTYKCALAGVAITGYAHAGWDICACTRHSWLEQDQTQQLMPINRCEE